MGFYKTWLASRFRNVLLYRCFLAYSRHIFNREAAHRFTQTSLGYLKQRFTLENIAAVGGSGFFATLAYVRWVAINDENKIKLKFNNPITSIQEFDEYVIRNDVETFLTEVLTARNVVSYWIISGQHGTGKTTAVQKVCHNIGKGIIYVDVPQDIENFKFSLADAIGLTHRNHKGLLSFIDATVYGHELFPGIFAINIEL